MRFPRKVILAAIPAVLAAIPVMAQKTPQQTVESFKLAPGLEAIGLGVRAGHDEPDRHRHRRARPRLGCA